MTKQQRSEQSTDDPTTDSKRFKWSPNLARGHLEICVEEKRKGNWQSKCLTEIGRMNLRAEFFKRFGLDWKYDKFRNRLDTVKRQHESYKRVIPDSSAVRFCEQTGAIEMPFSWWENLIKEKPEAKTLRNYPIRDIPLIEQLFSEESISVGDDGWQHHDGASHLPFEGNSVEDIELNTSPEAENPEQPQKNGKRSRSKQPKSSRKQSKENHWDRVLDLIEDQGRFFMGGRESFYTYSSAACVKAMEQMVFLNQHGELYWAALVFLEKNEQRRQIFMTLPDETKKIEYLERMTGKKNSFRDKFVQNYIIYHIL